MSEPLTHNGTATGDSGLSAAALPPMRACGDDGVTAIQRSDVGGS